MHKHGPTRPYQPMSRPSKISSRNGNGKVGMGNHGMMSFNSWMWGCRVAFARCIGEVGPA